MKNSSARGLPRWTQVTLKVPVHIIWWIYCFFYFRAVMAKHCLRGDITLARFLIILLPTRMRPKNFDYLAL